MSELASGTVPSVRKQGRLKTLVGTSIGNAVEWFDWNIYATFAAFFSTQIFDASDPQSAFLKTMAVFAVGFVARPFGGAVFGWVGDRLGRKHALVSSVLCASLGSLLIAFIPTYAQIGWLASALLVFARLLQGLAHGGEIPSAQTYLAEESPRHRRGLFSSAIYVSGTVGVIFGLALGLIMEAFLSDAQMSSWGWRVPFFVGAVLGFIGLWIRSSMEETEVFETHQKSVTKKKRGNMAAAVAANWSTGLKVILLTSGITVAYYIWAITMPSIAQTSFDYSAQDAFVASLVANFVMIAALPVWGWISDHIGRRPSMLISMLGPAVCYFPLMWLISSGQLWALLTAISVQLIFLSGFLSHAPATYAEMFPTEQRTSGYAVSYAIAIAAFGGTAGYVFTWLDNPYNFAIYSIALLLLSALTAFSMPETKGMDLSAPHQDEARTPGADDMTATSE